MTVQEAIEKIKWRIFTASEIVGCGEDGKAFEDLEMAIAALEKEKNIQETMVVKLNYLLNHFGEHCEEWGSDKEGDCNHKSCADCVLNHAIEIVKEVINE